MSIFAEKNEKKTLSRAVFVQIIVFTALVGLSAAALQPIQRALYQRMLYIRDNLIETAENVIGREIRYSSIRPTIFGSLDIRNLRITGNQNDLLSVSRIRISFSFWQLLRGNIDSVHRIQIEHPVFIMDLEKDRDILEVFSSFTEKNQNDSKEVLRKIAELLPEQPGIRIRSGSFNLWDGNKIYFIQDLAMHIRANGNEIFLDGKLKAGLNHDDIFNRAVGIRTSLNINGVYSVDQEEGRAAVIISSLSAIEPNLGPSNQLFTNLWFEDSTGAVKALFELHPANIGLVYKDQKINLSTLGVNPYDCFFDYSLETSIITAGINCRNFLLTDLLKFSGAWKAGNQLISQTVTGNAVFVHKKSGEVNYSVNFSGGNASGNSFVIRADGSENSITVDEFNFNSSPVAGAGPFYGRFRFSGKMELDPLSAWGTVAFDNFSFTGEDGINSFFLISSRDREITISGETLAIGQTVLNAPEIRLLLSDRDLEVIFTAGNFNLDAVMTYNPRQLEASIILDSFSSLELAEMLSPFSGNINIPSFSRSYLQDTSVAAEIYFTSDFKHIIYHAPNIAFVYNEGNKKDSVMGNISFSGTDQQLILTDGRFSSQEKEFLLSGNVNFSNPLDISFFINANYFNMSWQIEGQILDRSTLTIRDMDGLHVYGSISNTGAVSGYMEGLDFQIPINDRPAYLNFYMSLRYNSKDFWSFDIDHFEVRDFVRIVHNPASGDPGLLRITGAADQDGASFRNLLYRDDINALGGEADFFWARNFSDLRLTLNMGEEAGAVSPENEREYYFLDGLLEEDHFELQVSVRNMHLNRFIRSIDSALLNGEAAVSWDSIQSFRAELNLRSLNAKIKNNSISASAMAEVTNDELQIYDLRLGYNDISAIMPFLQLSRSENLVRANADIQGFVSGRKVEGLFELNANFKNIDSWLEINQILNSINGSCRANRLRYAEMRSQEPFIFMFSRNNGELSVSGGPKNMLRLEMDRDGNFFAGLSNPFPIRGSVVGVYRDGYIDGHCPDFFMDMSAFWAILPPMREFNISGGYITAALDIRGSVLDPEFFGSGRGSSFRLQVPRFVAQDIRPVPFNFTAEGNELFLETVTVVSGNGIGTADGWFRFDRWVPRYLGLEVTIPRKSPIPYRFNITSFHAEGMASGKIFLNLDDSVFDITGDLFANNAEMGLNSDELLQRRQNGEAPSNPGRRTVTVTSNLTITTGPSVEFIWPTSNFPILRANPEMGTVVRVSTDSSAGQYTLNSDVNIRGGEVYYFERSFYIRRGNLVFRENEQQFAPRLSARAEIRDRTDNGPVTISMIIENEPLLKFIPRFEANPSLTQLEIYSLLGQNLNNEDSDPDSAQRFFLSSTTDLLAQFVVVRQFERQIRNFLNLDMFTFRTRILQNAVINSTGLGQTPVDRNSRVGNYFDNTTVFGGKYVGQEMFVQGMISMRYDENYLALGGLRFEPDIGVELQSPFFSIRWDFFPYHPENWWVNDNSITLTWSRSF